LVFSLWVELCGLYCECSFLWALCWLTGRFHHQLQHHCWCHKTR
jgi:hypothetical protein